MYDPSFAGEKAEMVCMLSIGNVFRSCVHAFLLFARRMGRSLAAMKVATAYRRVRAVNRRQHEANVCRPTGAGVRCPPRQGDE